MPVDYKIAPWLRPADTTGAYAKGFGLGNQAGQAQAQIAMERARLNEASNRTAVEIALKQQQLEKESMVEAQKLEVAKAYHQQQAELKQQELEQKAQAIQEKVKQAAQQQIQMERYRQAIANGDDPALATLMHASGLPNMGGAVGTSIREISQRNNPKEAELRTARVGDADFPYLQTPNGAIHPLTMPVTKDATLYQLDQMIKSLPAKKRALGTNYNEVASGLMEMYKNKLKQTQGKPEAQASETKVNPWPTKLEDAVEGQIYNHPKRGPLRYDGSGKFSPVVPTQSATETPSDTEVADTGETDTTASEDNTEEA